MSHGTRTRGRLCTFVALAAMLTLPAGPAGAVDSSGLLCIGLHCGSPVSPSYIPEAHGVVPTLAGLDELNAQKESGFYQLPALAWQGDVRPNAVVYLSKPGQLEQMPVSVRNLFVVRDIELTLGSGLKSATLVVIDQGIMRVTPGDVGAA